MQVKTIVSFRNAFRGGILVTFNLMMGDSSDWQTFKIWVHPPVRSFADKAGGKGAPSANLNAAAPLCWKSDKDALTIYSVSEVYPMVVICLLWTRDSSSAPCRFWLPCHICNMPWTLAILCIVLCSASLFISESFSGFMLFNSGSVPAKILVLAWTNCLKTTFLPRVTPVALSGCSWSHLGQGKNRPALQHQVVWRRIGRVPHWRDCHTSSAFPPIDADSRLYLLSKMYC